MTLSHKAWEGLLCILPRGWNSLPRPTPEVLKAFPPVRHSPRECPPWFLRFPYLGLGLVLMCPGCDLGLEVGDVVLKPHSNLEGGLCESSGDVR